MDTVTTAKPKVLITMGHPNEVSGTTIMDDGTKVYWTDGRSSYSHVIYADGRTEKVAAWAQHPINEALHSDEIGEMRLMTDAEVIEYETARASL